MLDIYRLSLWQYKLSVCEQCQNKCGAHESGSWNQFRCSHLCSQSNHTFNKILHIFEMNDFCAIKFHIWCRLDTYKIFYIYHRDSLLPVQSRSLSWDLLKSLIFSLFEINTGVIFFQLFSQTSITWSDMNRNWNSWHYMRDQLADFSTTKKYCENLFMVSSYARKEIPTNNIVIFGGILKMSTNSNANKKKHNTTKPQWQANVIKHQH